MASAGQEIRGADGFRLLLLRTADDTDGEVLAMEATYGADAKMPPAHLHPSQVERFEVLDGAMNTIVGGVERRYEAGEVFEVPAGTVHTMVSDGPARVSWQVRPALRTAEFFERLHGGELVRNPEGAAAFLEEFRAEIRFAAS